MHDSNHIGETQEWQPTPADIIEQGLCADAIVCAEDPTWEDWSRRCFDATGKMY